MRAVIQRVAGARVVVDKQVIGEINRGLLVFLGVGEDDSEQDANYLLDKIVGLRVFEDQDYKMNLALSQVEGQLLIVSQFTIMGDCRKGRRPSFDRAARPERAKELYDFFVASCKEKNIPVATGCFQAEMLLEIFNDGPVTILLDSKKIF